MVDHIEGNTIHNRVVTLIEMVDRIKEDSQNKMSDADAFVFVKGVVYFDCGNREDMIVYDSWYSYMLNRIVERVV